MSEPREEKRGGSVSALVGAFVHGRREGDALVRERVKFLSGWARFGLAGLVIGALFVRQDADRREARQDRTEERAERSARDAVLAGSIIQMDKDVRDLRSAAEMEREVCWQIRIGRARRP